MKKNGRQEGLLLVMERHSDYAAWAGKLIFRHQKLGKVTNGAKSGLNCQPASRKVAVEVSAGNRVVKVCSREATGSSSVRLLIPATCRIPANRRFCFTASQEVANE